jgi:CheY-like chemotaxis protein
MGDGAGRVVVVDDDEDWRDLLVQLLQDGGFDAVGFSDGRQALAALRRGNRTPAVILLDLEMPVMTGWEFRREQLRDRRLARIPVVVASGADRGSIDADAYLAKPYTPADLFRVLDALSVRAVAA